MSDLRLIVEDVCFTVRAVILAQSGGRVLVERSPGVDFQNLVGGAAHTLEDLLGAARREWQEETGQPAPELHMCGLVENFFTLSGRRWHELGFYFRADLPEPLTLDAVQDLHQNALAWLPAAELERHRVFPLAGQDLLNVPAGHFRHLSVRDNGPTPPGQDLRLEVAGVGVQVRVHLLYVQGGQLLTNTVPGSGFWFLPGGTVALEEESRAAAHREFLEETGVPAVSARLVSLSEGFDHQGRRQQLGLCYLMEAAHPLPVTPYAVQDHDELQLQWVPLAEVDPRPVHPRGLSAMLSMSEGQIVHQIWESE